jgi:hypothetical protein
MSDLRISEKNRLYKEVSTLETYTILDDATIGRLRNQSGNVEYNTNKIEKLRTLNKERADQVMELKHRLTSLLCGRLDEELAINTKNAMVEIEKKTQETKRKKLENKAEENVRMKKSKDYYNMSRQYTREVRFNKRDADRAYKHFIRASDSIPDYILRNLRTMPSNKGYIWKNVCCYGERKAERNRPSVLFEKQRGGVLLIHEWTPSTYYLYSKTGKDRKVLVSQKPRKNNKLSGVSLMDFMTK